MINPQGLVGNRVAYVSATQVGTTGWMDAGGWNPPMSVIVNGVSASDAIEIRASNLPSKPDPTDNGVLVAAAVTADAIVQILTAFRWIRINRSTAAATPLVVNALLAAHRPPSA